MVRLYANLLVYGLSFVFLTEAGCVSETHAESVPGSPSPSPNATASADASLAPLASYMIAPGRCVTVLRADPETTLGGMPPGTFFHGPFAHDALFTGHSSNVVRTAYEQKLNIEKGETVEGRAPEPRAGSEQSREGQGESNRQPADTNLVTLIPADSIDFRLIKLRAQQNDVLDAYISETDPDKAKALKQEYDTLGQQIEELARRRDNVLRGQREAAKSHAPPNPPSPLNVKDSTDTRERGGGPRN